MASLFVWIITFDLSGMGGPTSSCATTSMALRIIWPHKPHHYINMAAGMWMVSGSDQAVSINFECSNWKGRRDIVHSEKVTLHGVISNESSVEFKLDIDELQELYMSTQSHVRNIMSSVVSKLEILYKSIECEVNKTPMMRKKWFDVVAERDIYETEKELTSIQNIRTVITSRTSPVTNTGRRRNGTKASKIIIALTSKCENNDGNQDGSRKVIIIGDSHIRGYASGLSHTLNKQYTVLMSKLTKNDILIFLGGASDVDKNASGKGLAQTVNFLRRKEHTNVIMINVPHRFDVDGKSCINEEVRRYNRKLSKIINKFENALLINVVSDRHLFTNHGLHMNVKGTEI
jgi:hypothetical protein